MRVKGGKWGKVWGLGIYPYKEGKIKPYQRVNIYNEAETLIGQINDMHQNQIPYLDTNLTDEELMSEWNTLWMEYGWMRREWIDEWLGERVFYDDRFW